MRVSSLGRYGLAAAITFVSSYPAWLEYFIHLDLFLSTAFVGPQSSNKTKPTIAFSSSTFPYSHRRSLFPGLALLNLPPAFSPLFDHH